MPARACQLPSPTHIHAMAWRFPSLASSTRRGTLGCAAVLLALFTPPEETGELVPAVPVSGLAQAQDCAVALPIFGHLSGGYLAPHGTIRISNDGGWCALQFTQTFRQAYIVPHVSVVLAPIHGQAIAQTLPGRIGLAYRPAPGFAGTDHFEVRTDGPLPHTIPIDVTIVPPGG